MTSFSTLTVRNCDEKQEVEKQKRIHYEMRENRKEYSDADRQRSFPFANFAYFVVEKSGAS